MQAFRRTLLLICLYGTSLAMAQTPPPRKPGLERIGHVIVLFLENRSFDHLYGTFPGADGVDQAGLSAIQVTRDGRPYISLPPVIRTLGAPPTIDVRFKLGIPNGPFREDQYVGLNEMTGDPVHRFNQEQEQIDGGRMDKFVAISDVGGLPMGYFDGSSLNLFQLAREYTLADHFFHAAYGGAFLNHMWLVCACTPRYPNAPEINKQEKLQETKKNRKKMLNSRKKFYKKSLIG